MPMKEMTPERFREIRSIMGLSQHKMANLLGYENRASVCLFENGNRPITPRIALLMELLADKHDMAKSWTTKGTEQ